MRTPKVLHCIWLSHNDAEFKFETVPKIVERCMRSILLVHGIEKPVLANKYFEMTGLSTETWEMIIWSNKSLTMENFPQNFYRISQCETLAQKSDLMRYEILARYGGWYVDADMYFFKSLDQLCNRENADQANQLHVCHESDGDPLQTAMMSTSIIGCTAYHPVLCEASRLVSSQPINTAQVNETTGPFFFGLCIKDSTFYRYESKTFYPMLWNFSAEEIIETVENDTENQFQVTIAAHCWLGSWKKHFLASNT